MTRYYDNINNRLVYAGKASNAEYWEKHWDKNTIEKLYPKRIMPTDYVINTTKKYLPKGSIILEGGCGTGQQVFKLQKSAYKVIGIDYAEKTVKIVKQAKPELDIRLGDVRRLDFDNNYFDGYWSFGVIEHFYNGYDEIINEMYRVLNPGGYLFVTFPHMSKLRKLKAKKGKYPVWNESEENIKNFYQFALDEKKVTDDLEKLNFKLIKKQHLSGIKGLKDEVAFVKNPLQKIFDSRSFFGMALSKMVSIVFNRFSSHSILLVLKKIK
ncbi:MAG: class I SAM-dependent methyltransferase [Bacteroidales bacterium]|nr:class I SAM-dependent methyltransferase [Bacteroidales bacterium]